MVLAHDKIQGRSVASGNIDISEAYFSKRVLVITLESIERFYYRKVLIFDGLRSNKYFGYKTFSFRYACKTKFVLKNMRMCICNS